MARAKADIFGFDELQKAMKRSKKQFDSDAEKLLHVMSLRLKKATKEKTPVHEGKYGQGKNRAPGTLKKSWGSQKIKEFETKTGTAKVARVRSRDPVAHLVEYGHEQVRGGGIYKHGKKGKKKLNRFERFRSGIKTYKDVPGRHMLEESAMAARKSFENNAEKLLNEITKEMQ